MKPPAEIEIELAPSVREPWYFRMAGSGGAWARQRCSAIVDPLRRSPIGYRLARGAFWALVSTVASRILALATSVIAARVLGREHFGELGVIQSTVILFGTLAGMGLGLTTTKYVAQFRLTDPAKAGRLISLCLIAGTTSGLLISAVVAWGAPWLATRTLADPHLGSLLRAGSLLIFLLGINGAQIGALSGFEAFRTVARINVLVGFVTCPLVVAGILLRGVEGAVWGNIVATMFNVWLNRGALLQESKQAGVIVRWKDCLQEWPILIGFSAPALIANMLAAPVNWGCNALLVNQPHGYAEMGVLNATNQWYFAVLFLPGALISNAMPVLAERVACGDHAGLRKTLALCLKISAAVVLPVVLFGSLANNFILGIYGASFQEHSWTMIVSLVTAGLLSFQMPVGQIVVASGRMWMLTGMQLIWAFLFCGGTWFLVSWGALGLVTARLAAYAVLTAITAALAWKQLRPLPDHLVSPHL